MAFIFPLRKAAWVRSWSIWMGRPKFEQHKILQSAARWSTLSLKCHFPWAIELKRTLLYSRASVSIETLLVMPSPSSSPWHFSFSIRVQCPAMCLVPDGGNVCPAVSLSWAGRVSTEIQRWSVVLWVPFQSRRGGWNLSITRNLNKKKKENTAPHLPWYAAYVILHERKLQIAFIMTYNAWVMPDCDILIQ